MSLAHDPWIRRTMGTSYHEDGHKVGLFPDNCWWLYPKGWPATADAQGPFKTREEAEQALGQPQLLHCPSRYAEASGA